MVTPAPETDGTPTPSPAPGADDEDKGDPDGDESKVDLSPDISKLPGLEKIKVDIPLTLKDKSIVAINRGLTWAPCLEKTIL
jgi:hypothetical protein